MTRPGGDVRGLGLSLVVLDLLALLALMRCRSMIPLVFALLLEQVGRRLIFTRMPVERAMGIEPT